MVWSSNKDHCPYAMVPYIHLYDKCIYVKVLKGEVQRNRSNLFLPFSGKTADLKKRFGGQRGATVIPGALRLQ